MNFASGTVTVSATAAYVNEGGSTSGSAGTGFRR